MKAFLVLSALLSVSVAAVQQQRSPVYTPTVTSTGATTSVNSTPLVKSSPINTSPMTPPPIPQIAEPRESVGTDATMINSQAVSPGSTPSQNYYVYYYPNQGQTQSVGQPNSSSIWTWSGWTDVGAAVGSLALVLIGGAILYTRYGTEVKSRALRELKDLTSDDAVRMARNVLQALERFSNINNDTE